MQNSGLENALSPIRAPIRSFTFSFALGIFLLVECVILMAVGTLGYFSLRDTSKQLEIAFTARGRELALAVSAGANLGYEKGQVDKLNTYLGAIVARNQYAGGERPVAEVFILEKNGRVPAHSDLALVSAKKTNEEINRISELYNTDLYHSALTYEETSVLVQNLPTPSGIFRDKNMFLVDWFMPSDVHHPVDFSLSLSRTQGKKPEKFATTHVVMNRIHEYYFLHSLLVKYLIIAGISLLAGFLITAILLSAFALRAGYIQTQWRESVQHRWEKELMRLELKSGIDSLNAKVSDIEKKASLIPPEVVNKPKVLDAILVE